MPRPRYAPIVLYDITVAVSPGMHVFEGDPAVRIERVTALAEGGICNLSRFEGTLHTGTHVDAPCHFIDGAGGVETLSLDAMLGPCTVVDATALTAHVSAGDVERLVPAGAERVLFKTANGRLWNEPRFSRGFFALDESAAAALARRGVRLVGIDYLSIAPFEDPAPVHRTLLGAGVVAVEGLLLRDVAPGEYELAVLPLLIPGADGAPARAVLRS
jgi:arylformamidase